MISCPSLNQSKITQHTLKITFSKANSHHIWLHGTFSSLPPDAECNFSAVIKLGQKEKMAFNILKHVKSEKKKSPAIQLRAYHITDSRAARQQERLVLGLPLPVIPPFILWNDSGNCHKCSNNHCLWGVSGTTQTQWAPPPIDFNQIKHPHTLETATAWNCDPQNPKLNQTESFLLTPTHLTGCQGYKYNFSYIIYLLSCVLFCSHWADTLIHGGDRRDSASRARTPGCHGGSNPRPSSRRTETLWPRGLADTTVWHWYIF